MQKVAIKDNQIRVGSRNIPLVSGEVHYWRLNPNYWTQVLSRVRDLGIEVVSTYVPWHYHEYKRGKFDFTGKTDPTRDLKAFLQLIKKEGFWLVIRPGPYIYSEWPNDGVPAYAYKYHRLHPKFLEYARKYLKEVMKVIRPHLATKKGGRIILLQADNEIDPWPDLFGYQYGLNHQPGMFQDFLKELYEGDLKELNANWATSYRSFEEAGPFIATMLQDETGLPLKGDKELQRNLDYLKFKYAYAKKCAAWNVEAYRQLGVDVPVYLNVYPFFYAHDWVEMQNVSDMVGVDLYPSSELAEDEFEQRKFLDKIRYLKNISKIPFIAEFSSGVWHARHYESGVLTPNHYRLITLSAILGGVAGWNWYMLVNRDNWYMSPINEWGIARGELYDVFKQMVRVHKQIMPPTLEKISEIALTFNSLQYAARTVSHDSPIPVALYNSDIDYELYDARFKTCDKPFLFYSGNQWLERSAQENLRRYVEEGGTLIAFRDYPRKDERFRPCSLIGFEDPKSILFEFKRKFSVQFGPKRRKIDIFSSVFCFEAHDAQKVMADLGPFGKEAVGYIKKIGKGRIVHLGFEPSKPVILELLDCLGITPGSRSTTRDVKTALFKRGKRFYLVAVNNGEEDKSASVYLPAMRSLRGKMRVRTLIRQRSEDYSFERRNPFTIEIPRKDGEVVEFS